MMTVEMSEWTTRGSPIRRQIISIALSTEGTLNISTLPWMQSHSIALQEVSNDVGDMK